MKSSYSFMIDGRVLYIEDKDQGGKSVTNDIENVLSEIQNEIGHSVDNYDVIYKDSQGIIDGVKTSNGKFSDFYHIGETDFHAAKLKIK